MQLCTFRFGGFNWLLCQVFVLELKIPTALKRRLKRECRSRDQTCAMSYVATANGRYKQWNGLLD